ncbi:MAG TPA: hypothetical protein VIS74_07355, partial [Chthoniobacterales bacterium]
ISGNLPEAKRVIARALELEPNKYAYMTTFSQICLDAGDHEEAIDWARKATQICPVDPQTFRHLALTCQLSGSSERALAALKEAQTFHPNNSPLMELMEAIKLNKDIHDELDAST